MLFSFLLISKETRWGGGSERWVGLVSAAYGREGNAAESRFTERCPQHRPVFHPKGQEEERWSEGQVRKPVSKGAGSRELPRPAQKAGCRCGGK